MVMAQLNMDMIREILSRLRVKDLIRFKSVCKFWFQVISNKDFIKVHLQRSSFRPMPLESRHWRIDCDRSPTLRHFGCHIFCGSSSDGLVCLFNEGVSIIHIWNPALRSSACIPMTKSAPSIGYYWFGLHNDEYKLVLGTCGELDIHVIRPYKDSSYNWKTKHKFGDGYCRPSDREIGTLFNGIVHWPVRKWPLLRSNYCTMLSYNLHQGKVGEIALPVDEHFRLGEIDGCLSAVFLNTVRGEHGALWVMKEYGVKESWTKMMVLNLESASFDGIRPSGNVLDDHATIKSPFYRKEFYVESLVSPKLCSHKSV